MSSTTSALRNFKFELGVPQTLLGMELEESARVTAAWVAAAVRQWYPKSLSDCPFKGLFGALIVVVEDYGADSTKEFASGSITSKMIAKLEDHYSRADGSGGWRENISPLDRLTRSCQLTEIRSSWVRACQISRTLFDLAEYMDYKGKPEWSRVLLRYFLLDLCCFSIETLKYHTLYLGNLVKEEETKRKPAVEGIAGLLIDGAFRRFCLQKLRKSGRRAWILSDTLHMGVKRGFPSMKDIEVEDSLRDYQLSLSREKEILPEVDSQIRRTALELFGDAYPVFEQFPVSMSATLGWTRKDYGMRGFLVRDLYSNGDRWGVQDAYWYAVLKTGAVSIFGGYEYNRYLSREYRVEPEIDYMSAFVHYVNRSKGRLESFLEARVAVVREPLKVRPITAGPEDHYVLLKPFQMSMWSSLQRFRQFQLTGREFDEEALDVLKLVPKKFGPAAYNLNAFISGDYSQATNDLAAGATRAVWETAWGSEYWDIVGPALNGHLIHLPNTTFYQSNGQLMGSPISFPVLCCINAAIGRWSYEEYIRVVTGETVSLKVSDCPMLVNGDDFAAASNWAHHEIWKGMVKKVGWTLSVGKSYFSNKFVQINSRTCPIEWYGYDDGDVVDLESEWQCWWTKRGDFAIDYRPKQFRLLCNFQRMIPFVNFGFLEMMSKDTAQLDQPLEGQVTVGWEGRLRWVKRDAYWQRQIKILRRNFLNQLQTFLSEHKLGRGDVDPDLSTKLGGLSLNPLCTCDAGACQECARRISEHRPKFAFRGVRVRNFPGLNGEERPSEGYRLERWSEAVEWRRPPGGTVEKCRSCGDVYSMNIPAISSESAGEAY